MEAEGKRRNKWSSQEDEIIHTHVRLHGAKDWGKLADTLQSALGGSRTAKSCRLRWFNELTPSINRTPFSDDEMAFIMRSVVEHGTAWSRISSAMAAAGMTGRTDNAIKNCYHVRLKRTMQEQGMELGAKPQPLQSPLGSYMISAGGPGSGGGYALNAINLGSLNQTFSHDGSVSPGCMSGPPSLAKSISEEQPSSRPTSQNGSGQGSPKRCLNQRQRIHKRPSRLGLGTTISQLAADSADDDDEEVTGDHNLGHVIKAEALAGRRSDGGNLVATHSSPQASSPQVRHVKHQVRRNHQDKHAEMTSMDSAPDLATLFPDRTAGILGSQATHTWQPSAANYGRLNGANEVATLDFFANLDPLSNPVPVTTGLRLSQGGNLITGQPGAQELWGHQVDVTIAPSRPLRKAGILEWSPFEVSKMISYSSPSSGCGAASPAPHASGNANPFAVAAAGGNAYQRKQTSMNGAATVQPTMSAVQHTQSSNWQADPNSAAAAEQARHMMVRFADMLLPGNGNECGTASHQDRNRMSTCNSHGHGNTAQQGGSLLSRAGQQQHQQQQPAAYAGCPSSLTVVTSPQPAATCSLSNNSTGCAVPLQPQWQQQQQHSYQRPEYGYNAPQGAHLQQQMGPGSQHQHLGMPQSGPGLALASAAHWPTPRSMESVATAQHYGTGQHMMSMCTPAAADPAPGAPVSAEILRMMADDSSRPSSAGGPSQPELGMKEIDGTDSNDDLDAALTELTELLGWE